MDKKRITVCSAALSSKNVLSLRSNRTTSWQVSSSDGRSLKAFRTGNRKCQLALSESCRRYVQVSGALLRGDTPPDGIFVTAVSRFARHDHWSLDVPEGKACIRCGDWWDAVQCFCFMRNRRALFACTYDVVENFWLCIRQKWHIVGVNGAFKSVNNDSLNCHMHACRSRYMQLTSWQITDNDSLP